MPKSQVSSSELKTERVRGDDRGDSKDCDDDELVKVRVIRSAHINDMKQLRWHKNAA